MNGPAICKAGREVLEAAGWFVVIFNHHKAMPTGLRGVPDMMCWKADRTILVEVKGEGDRMRPEQTLFEQRIKEHAGPHLCYFVARNVADFERIVTWNPST